MAAHLKHFPEYNLDLGVATGVMTDHEALEHFSKFNKKAHWLGVFTKDADLSSLDITSLPKLRQVVTPDASEPIGAEPKKSALVIHGESSELFIRFWVHYASAGVRRSRQRKIFKTIKKACRWLELPPGAAEKLAAAVTAAESGSEADVSEETETGRNRLLKSASHVFGERGFEAMSVAEVAAASALPREALHGLSDSKDDLIVNALLNALGEIAPIEGDLARFAAAYLSPARMADVAGGCAMAALASDMLRESPQARAALTAALTWHIDRLSRIAPGDDPAARRRAAVRAWSAMIGALLLARVSDDEALSQEFLDDAQSWIADPAVAAGAAAGSRPPPEFRPPS
jgi:TetR/AcrR family transcriptional repressor of nem operon